VSSSKPEKRYFESWLRRVGRQLATSGRLSQIATILASENEGTAEEWSKRLRTVLDGNETPSIELLTRIDALLAGPSKPPNDQSSQEFLF